ncbi:uncharacterized protein I206_107502 [Kwoniella pini CBS 10737]|uniref:GH18 domain-containing protein n=1 Tax=Kwoniella pini CBS 10737 TaxID=1296096 RepID=A0A1B9HXH3_9TREE|nr:uncharacterized protein I206_05830 [Kwoniella pini CBS 10737]OCF47964.1 hypothetical protein I206_05830 [Kwoniella pini CBS 10737]
MKSSMINHAIYLTLSIILFTSEPINAAGPHNRFGVNHHRRHHARAAATGATNIQQEIRSTQELIQERQEECTLGAWKCVGSELQRCYNDQWNFVTNCTGTDIICSDGLYTTGCVWTWSVEQNDDNNQSATSSPPFSSSITAIATSSATSTTIPSITNANLAVEPTASTDDEDVEECEDGEDFEENEDEEDDDDDELPYCDDEEADSASATATPSIVASSAVTTPSAVGGQLVADPDTSQDDDEDEDEDDDEEDCDEADPHTDSTTSVSPTSTTSAETTSTSVIGGQLWAGGDGSWDTTASATTHDWYNTNDPYSTGTATTTSHDWYNTNDPYSTDTATSSSGSDQAKSSGHHRHKSSSASSADWAAITSASTSYDDGSWSPTKYDSASAATSTGWNRWSGESSSSAAWGQESSSASGKHGKASASASASASAATAKTTGSPSGSFSSAPHYVIYSDMWLTEMPSVDVLSNFNRFILAFWMTNQGAVDNAQFWEQLDTDTRQQTITEYHNAGIALMVSAFGSTDSPTSNGADPTQTAQQLAQWVKDYGLDGVDIDYEDMSAMNSAQAVSWIVTFQKELRNQLPSPYIISHAPVAPWFTSAKDYSDGAYVSIHEQTGDGIDFYNVQFYNQGDGVYEDCETLLFDSGNDWPSTSVFEINSSAGLPLDKIVIGKPLDEGAAANGFVDPSVLHKCVTQAEAKGWNAGVMFWEWTTSAPSIMGTVRGTT